LVVIAEVAEELEVIDKISRFVGFVGLEVVLLVILGATLEVVIHNDSFVVADDEVGVGYREHVDGKVEVEFTENDFGLVV
jgi:hypothetical protein